jgi:hypothetical protein
MSTAPVSSSPVNQQQNESYLQTRRSDLRQLGAALASGNLSDAETAFNNITALGQSGPFNGNAFQIAQREQDFTSIGQALQSGNLADAQQAFGALKSTFGINVENPLRTNNPVPSSGPEVVLNLSNSSSSSPEQITINIGNSANGGGEQVSLSVGNQGSNAQQVTFNLSPNSNEQIVVNLSGEPSTTTTSSSSAPSSTGLSVSA